MTNHQIYALLKYYYVLKSIREKLKLKNFQEGSAGKIELEALEGKIRTINKSIKNYCAMNNSLLKKDEFENANSRLKPQKQN